MTLFSVRLKWLRERKGLSQKEMAEKIGMTQQGYSKIELGQREPNLLTLCKIKHVLEESLDFIIGYHFEDMRAEYLYELYVESRRMREETEEDIEYAESTSSDIDTEKHIKLMRVYKSGLKDNVVREEKAFNQYFEYISKIPGFDGEMATREFWIARYPSHKENDKASNHKFWDELVNIHPVDSELGNP